MVDIPFDLVAVTGSGTKSKLGPLPVSPDYLFTYGMLFTSVEDYTFARSGAGGAVSRTMWLFGGGMFVGQNKELWSNPPAVYHNEIYETFLSFDLSSLSEEVTSAKLRFYILYDASAQDFTIEVRRHDFDYLNTNDWVAGDDIDSNTLAGSIETSELVANCLVEIDIEPSVIEAVSNLGFLLTSDRTLNAIEPTIDVLERVTIYKAHANDSFALKNYRDPQLIINGSPANGIVLNGISFDTMAINSRETPDTPPDGIAFNVLAIKTENEV
jgi:hypothetical protein